MNITSSLGYKLAELLRLKRCFIDQRVKKLELSRTQWRVLVWLSILGPCLQQALLTALDIDPGHLTRVLDEFEKNKIISRTRLKEDRRALFIEITKRGEAKYISTLKKVLKEENTILMTGLSEKEKNFLMKILEKVKLNMETALKK